MKDNVTIRRCVPGDEQALAMVGQATFLESLAGYVSGADILAHCPNLHSPLIYSQWLHQPSMSMWLAEVQPGGAPVGYLVMGPANEDDPRGAVRIRRVYLLHRFQGMKIGRRLMDAALAQARRHEACRAVLHVYIKNLAGLAFYHRYGFSIAGARNYRVNGVDYDNHVMALQLR